MGATRDRVRSCPSPTRPCQKDAGDKLGAVVTELGADATALKVAGHGEAHALAEHPLVETSGVSTREHQADRMGPLQAHDAWRESARKCKPRPHPATLEAELAAARARRAMRRRAGSCASLSGASTSRHRSPSCHAAKSAYCFTVPCSRCPVAGQPATTGLPQRVS